MDGTGRAHESMKRQGLFWDIVRWLKPTVEGPDGVASFRRFVAFTLIILDIFLVVGDKLNEGQRLAVYYANLVTVLLIIGIITTQNILEFFNRGNKNGNNEQ